MLSTSSRFWTPVAMSSSCIDTVKPLALIIFLKRNSHLDRILFSYLGKLILSLFCLFWLGRSNGWMDFGGDYCFLSLQPFSYRRNVASLFLFHRCFHQRFSDEIHSLVPLIQEFPIKTLFAVPSRKKSILWKSSPCQIHIPLQKLIFKSICLGNLCGVMIKLLDCGLELNKCEHRLRHSVDFSDWYAWKRHDSLLSLQLWVKLYHWCSFISILL